MSIHPRLFKKGAYIACDSVPVGLAQVGEELANRLSVGFEIGGKSIGIALEEFPRDPLDEGGPNPPRALTSLQFAPPI
jgi:hypothetical protein